VDTNELLADWWRNGERRGLERSSLAKRDGQMRTLWRATNRPLLSLTACDLERFVDARPITSRTRYHYLSTFSTFYTWAVIDGRTTTNPASDLVRPRLRRLLPRPITTDDLALAISAAPLPIRCWLLLAAYQGFRCMEIAGLERDDVLETHRPKSIVAHGKGSKDRVLPLHAAVEAELLRLPMPRRGLVFRKPLGSPWRPAEVSSTINHYLHDDLGLDWTAHQLRHWFGTNLYAGTDDLRLVQEMMGHSSPVTTAGYVQWSRAKAVDAIGALSVAE
jgi:integrase